MALDYDSELGKLENLYKSLPIARSIEILEGCVNLLDYISTDSNADDSLLKRGEALYNDVSQRVGRFIDIKQYESRLAEIRTRIKSQTAIQNYSADSISSDTLDSGAIPANIPDSKLVLEDKVSIPEEQVLQNTYDFPDDISIAEESSDDSYSVQEISGKNMDKSYRQRRRAKKPAKSNKRRLPGISSQSDPDFYKSRVFRFTNLYDIASETYPTRDERDSPFENDWANLIFNLKVMRTCGDNVSFFPTSSPEEMFSDKVAGYVRRLRRSILENIDKSSDEPDLDYLEPDNFALKQLEKRIS